MMDIDAIRTIRFRNRTKKSIPTYEECEEIVNKQIDLITSKYPMGLENTYFVLKGFEDVTKHQPIINFKPAEGIWKLESTTKFILI